MRLVFLALIAVLLAVPAPGLARPGVDDGTVLVTPDKPLVVSVQVAQAQGVVIRADLEQGGFKGLQAHIGQLCSTSTEAGAAAPVSSSASQAFSLDCGRMEAGWYKLTVTIDAGAARLRFATSGASVYGSGS